MKVLVIGTVDETHSQISGQFDRTEIIRDGLIKAGYDVSFVNMMNWQRNKFTVFGAFIKQFFISDAVLFLASLNGTRVILNIISFLRFFSAKPVFQIAIGGMSNCEFVKNNLYYRNIVRKLKSVFVEVESMIQEYKSVGIDNVVYLPNCKFINTSVNHGNPSFMKPYRFCTYSRITPSKGIKEAIDVIERLNKRYGLDYCTLDIYGTYLSEDEQWFKMLMGQASDAVKFKGRIERKDSISTLSQYDAMLFPTKHLGEGVPGGMIDCYEAGLPIIVRNTSFMSTIVLDGKTGFVYNGDEELNLDRAIIRYTEGLTVEEKKVLRKECIKNAGKYDTNSVIKTLSKYLNDSI